jgi:hypothetical protein
LQFLAEVALGRELDPREAAVFLDGQKQFRSYFGANLVAARQVLAVGESAVDPGLDAAELATWTMTASQFLNLDEFFNK